MGGTLTNHEQGLCVHDLNCARVHEVDRTRRAEGAPRAMDDANARETSGDDSCSWWRACGFPTRAKCVDVVVNDDEVGPQKVRLVVRYKNLDTTTTTRTRTAEEDEEEEEEFTMDPYFFDPGYTIAATTGFCRVWEGAETLSKFLMADAGRVRGKKCVELGAGVGECGLVAATIGAHVVLTDVHAVAENVIRRNVGTNGCGDAARFGADAWPRSARVGRGSATHATLDWFDPIPETPFGGEHNENFYDAEVILAAECVWLRDLVPAFVETNRALLSRGVEKELILSFRDRSSTDDAASGKAFAGYREVVRAFEDAGHVCEVLQRTASIEDVGKEIIIYRVTRRRDNAEESNHR